MMSMEKFSFNCPLHKIPKLFILPEAYHFLLYRVSQGQRSAVELSAVHWPVLTSACLHSSTDCWSCQRGLLMRGVIWTPKFDTSIKRRQLSV